MVWIFLVCLGLALYFIVRHSVVRVTTTPWWQLWFVLMLPAFLIAGWELIDGPGARMPVPILVGAFLLSLLLYYFLLRMNPTQPEASPPSPPEEEKPEATPLSQAEQAQLQHCFPWSVYYLQQVDYRPQAVICRGQLRSSSEQAYQTIRKNVQAQFGDRFLVMFQTGALNKPFFALVSNPYGQRANQDFRPGMALVLLGLTLLTTTVAGLALVDGPVTPEQLTQNPVLLQQGLPYAIALLLILGIHELGHYWTAAFYKLRTTLPYFIPFPYAFGTLGAYIQMRSPAPDRKALFDIGIAGPIAGFLVTLPILIWGLVHSEVVTLPEEAAATLAPQVFDPRLSLMLGVMARGLLGSALTTGMGISLHPVAVAGWLGLVVTALNLMPIGQLDGGHIVHAMFGQRAGILIGQVSRLLVLLLAMIQPFLLFWGLLLLFMPVTDEPALNDVSELNGFRDVLGLLSLALLLAILLPVPSALESVLFAANPLP